MASTTATLDGFPDASNTGVRPGVALKVVGDMTVTTPGAVISGLEIHGRLTIEAPNVTVVDCKIVNNEWDAIMIPDPYKATVEHCTIVGGVNGIAGAGTFQYNDISHNENGINVYGPSMIANNYIHDMSGNSDSHYDGIEINGGGGTTIQHNTIINDYSQTSAVMINNNFGGVDGIIVNDNYLAGGGYTIYSDGRTPGSSISGVQITNNVLGEGYWGYYAFMANDPVVTNNTELGKDWPTPDATDTTSGGTTTTTDPTTTDPTTTTGGSTGSSSSGSSSGSSSSGSSSSGSSAGSSSGSGTGSKTPTTTDTSHHHTPSSSSGSNTSTSTSMTGNDKVNTINGDSHDNTINGKGGNDVLNGGGGNDKIFGGAGNDKINGGAGNDTINGGAGHDVMTGGAGNDKFVFTSVNDIGVNSYRDDITDFTHGQDKIDLSALDAIKKVAGNQAFSFLAADNAAFTHTAGQVAWHTDAAHDYTVVQGDMNGDGKADFEIELHGIVHLTSADFIL